ncbi:hypothetical protein, partial [Corynebacterium belfantii]
CQREVYPTTSDEISLILVQFARRSGTTYDYVIGMDVGKYFHHACVLDIDGAQVLSKRINQNEK